MNNSYYNNSIISLEEENYLKQKNPIQKKKKVNTNKNKSSLSFFGKIINSVSKIGQGLKDIMSMKINIENEDDNNPDLYNQISNRYNTNEEINLIDAPSFMEESFIRNTSNKKNYSNNKEHINTYENENNNMIISQNDIQDKDNNIIKNNIELFNNSFNNKNENIINEDIIQKKDPEINIKSMLLNKKRANSRHLESIIEEEEEKNEEQEQNNINTSISKIKAENNKPEISINNSSKINLRNSKYINSNNISSKNRINNTSSMMSLSMKSLESIKNEISKRREENLRNVEEMHKRHGLNYDYDQEKKIREKILDEYYKDKAKRIAEGKLKMEKEKQKREEEFNKLKIRKINEFKFTSHKKPKILTETKNTQIHFKPMNDNNIKSLSPKDIDKKQANTFNKVNSLQNFSFSNASPIINNDNDSKENKDIKNKKEEKEDKKEIKVDNKDKKEMPSLLWNQGDKKEIPSLFGNQGDKKEIPSLFGNQGDKKELSSLFGNQGDKKVENKLFGFQDNKKDEHESKLSKGLLFDNVMLNPNNDKENNKKIEEPRLPKLVEKSEESNEKAFDNKTKSIFSSFIVQEPQKEIKGETKPDNNIKQDGDYFGSSINVHKGTSFANQPSTESLFKGNANPNNNQNIFTTENTEKNGLFNQQSKVSSSINNTNLFQSNNANNQGAQNKSLVNNTNPFLNPNFSSSATNLFGAPISNNNNQNQNQSSNSLFGFKLNNNQGSQGSLFK